MDRHQLLGRLARPAAGKIVLFVVDGLGDIRTAGQPRTALEAADLPNLDALARRSALGRLVPVAVGVTPGSGPGHLALFGYDPTAAEVQIGRGVLEALGVGIEVRPGDIAARGNFATADRDGNLTDRRAGRIATAEAERLVEKLRGALAEHRDERLQVELVAGEGHRFVLLLRGAGLSAEIADTDPQELGVPPLAPVARAPAAEETVRRLTEIIARMEEVLAGEPRANRVLLRGFSRLPHLPQLPDLYQLRCGAFAGYPLYRGVAAACGMEVIECGKAAAEVIAAAGERWDDFDFFFLHVKRADQAGEDGDLAAKVAALEEVDAALPALLDRGPAVLAVTGDHSTPAPLKSHSWHPVPVLLHSDRCFADGSRAFTEATAAAGHLGTLRSMDLLGLLLANAGRLAKFGA